MTTSGPSLSRLLEAHRKGDPLALERLSALLYRDLKRLAHLELGRLRPWETLDTTGLVHEAYIKVARRRRAGWEGRTHFLGAAAKAMRHILVDAARRRLSLKQGGGRRPEALDEALCASENHAEAVIAIDQALDGLRARLLHTIGRIYGRMELTEEAEPLLEEALAQSRASPGDHRLEQADILADLGAALIDTPRVDGAEAALREALATRLELLGRDHAKVAATAL